MAGEGARRFREMFLLKRLHAACCSSLILLFGFLGTGWGQTFSVIYNFTGAEDGAHPIAGLTTDGVGNFYGTTLSGGLGGDGDGWGVVYRLSRSNSGWNYKTLYRFIEPSRGLRPWAGVTVANQSTLYGATEIGGDPNWTAGTIYSLAAPAANPTVVSSWSENVLFAFNYYDGDGPLGEPILDQVGRLYGTTNIGGRKYWGGVAYRLEEVAGNWQETVLWEFGNGLDGVNPEGPLIFDSSGNLYGVTSKGGKFNRGTIFELMPTGQEWTEKVLYDFRDQEDGMRPYAGLIFDNAGNLYGSASCGGKNQIGTVFELIRSGDSWIFKLLYPVGTLDTLTMDKAGNIYGAQGGGLFGHGAVFTLSPTEGLWKYTDLHDFNGIDGDLPWGRILVDADGSLYGTTDDGGPYQCRFNSGCGNIYQIRFP